MIVTLLAMLVASATPPAAGAEGDGRGQRWLGTWAASPSRPDATGLSAAGFSNQTVRQVVYPHVAGHQLRIRLTNSYGSRSLPVGQVNVAWQGVGAATMPNSDRQLTFGGRGNVLIPVGADVYSDPVALEVAAGRTLAISLYLPEPTGPATWHPDARQSAYLADGNQAAVSSGDAFSGQIDASWFYLDGVDVTATPDQAAVVTLGDSITDGAASTLDANNRWPDILARRLNSRSDNQLSVLSAGISGNSVLTDAGVDGANAVARLDRDVLAQDGVRYVTLLEGINDIGGACRDNRELAVEQLISAYQQIITQVQIKGLKIFGATILPFEDALYYCPAGEATRQTLNAWIRSSGEFDGVIDFDQATRDPAMPSKLLAAYDSGDHLHPNDSGYQAMADAIDLSLFTPDPVSPSR